jgi:hypothetical protein
MGFLCGLADAAVDVTREPLVQTWPEKMA